MWPAAHPGGMPAISRGLRPKADTPGTEFWFLDSRSLLSKTALKIDQRQAAKLVTGPKKETSSWPIPFFIGGICLSRAYFSLSWTAVPPAKRC